MNRMQLSLRSLLLICVYAAICSMVYVHPNLLIGTLVVVATIVWFTLATLHAFRRQNTFSLVFALCGWSWLVFWLGFYAQTPSTSAEWNLGKKIYQAATLFRPFPQELNPGSGEVPEMDDAGRLESIYESTPMLIIVGEPGVPAGHNAIRLMVCLSALLVGLLGGSVASYATGKLHKTHPPKAIP